MSLNVHRHRKEKICREIKRLSAPPSWAEQEPRVNSIQPFPTILTSLTWLDKQYFFAKLVSTESNARVIYLDSRNRQQLLWAVRADLRGTRRKQLKEGYVDGELTTMTDPTKRRYITKLALENRGISRSKAPPKFHTKKTRISKLSFPLKTSWTYSNMAQIWSLAFVPAGKK